MVDVKVLEGRKKDLENAKDLLKKEFIGIDDQIDDVINLLSSWYIFPDGQMRPLIINLVGMTGVGKTSLIERLFEILGLDKSLYKFDMGYYSSSKEDLKYDLSKKVKSYNNQPVCFALDEFQLGRSIDKTGSDLNNHGYRPIWDLMDSGKIKLLESNGNSDILYNLTLKINIAVSSGVRSNGLFVTKEKDKFLQIFGDDSYESDYYIPDGTQPNSDQPLIIPELYYYYLNSAQGTKFDSESELKAFLKRMKDEQEVLDFINDCFEKSITSKVYDFSNSLIFTISNIDGAFYNAHSVDPDMDPDFFHKETKGIKLSKIKSELLKMFRPEQVARLGNNFVIYPSFSSDTYKGIIDLELQRVSKSIKEKFGFDISFDDSIRNILYKEGVFPTQGARPTITTVNNIIGSYVGKILCDVLLSESDDNNLLWSFSEADSKSLVKAGGKSFFYDVKLKVNEDRKPKMNDEYATTVVHEAGHALLSIALLGVVPNKIIASSAGAASGFVLSDIKDELMSEDMVKKYTAMLLGGIEAEKMVFGKDYATFGASSDLTKATEYVVSLFEKSGIYKPYISTTEPLYDDSMSVPPLSMEKPLEESLRDIFSTSRNLAQGTLGSHKEAFEALCKLLYDKSEIGKKELREFAIEHNLFLNGENYLDNFYVNKFNSYFKKDEK